MNKHHIQSGYDFEEEFIIQETSKGAKVRNLGKFAPIDFMTQYGDKTRFVELKRRHHNFNQKDELPWIGLNKMIYVEMLTLLGFDVLLLIKYNDGTYCINMSKYAPDYKNVVNGNHVVKWKKDKFQSYKL